MHIFEHTLFQDILKNSGYEAIYVAPNPKSIQNL